MENPMKRFVVLSMMLGLSLAACDGGNSTQDTLSRVDVIVPEDQGLTDTTPPQDTTPPRDQGATDPGTVDPGRQDLGTQDTPPVDQGTPDATTQDSPPVDQGVQDPGQDPGPTDVADPGPTDVAVQDLPTTGDLPPVDAGPFECAGTCDPNTQTMLCMPDGLTICYCNPDSGNWEPYACGDVCTANGMVGTACILGEQDYTCDCSFDCSQPDLVTTQCENLSYTPCTCGAADPCGWLGDGFCDAPCVTAFPEDHFVDTADCTCGGTCDPQQFSGYCDLNGNPCNCGNDGNQALTDCEAYCTDQGAVVKADQRCAAFFGMAFCNCQDWTCGDPGQVQKQCEAAVYTPCTCAAADPCLWIGDGSCDSQSCNSLYPDQPNLDDVAQDCQG